MRLGVLRDSAFRRLLGAEWVSLLGDFALIPIIPYAVKEQLGGTNLQVAIVFAAEYVMLSAFVLFGGVVGDRFPRRTTMIGADLARFVALVCAGFLLIGGNGSVGVLVVAQVVLGVGGGFFGPALMGLVPQTVAEDTLQEANAMRGMALASATMVGPAFGGLMLALGSPGTAYVADGVTFLLSAWLLSGLRPIPGTAAAAAEDGEEPGMIAQLREGWSAFWSRTWLWTVVLAFGVFNTAVMAPFAVLGPGVMDGSGSWSTTLALRGAGSVIGCIVLLAWRPRRPLVAGMFAVALWIPLPLLMAGTAPLVTIGAAAIVAGGGGMVFDALWQTTMQSHVPEDQISRVGSYDWLAGLGMVPLGYLFGAAMAETVGAASGLVAGAAITAVMTLAVLAVPSVRNLRRVDDEDAAAPPPSAGEPLTDAA